MPEEALVAEAPAGLVLTQHVDKGVHVEARLLGPDPEHHARPEDPGFERVLYLLLFCLKMS